MKTQVADSHYRTYCLKIQPKIGAPIMLTQFPKDLTMSNGAVYTTAAGYQFTGLQSTSSMSATVVDLEGIAGIAGITRAAVASGIFDGARCDLFATDWRTPVEDYEPLTRSVLGKVTLIDDRYKVEEMSIIDLLGQSVGVSVMPSCRHTFNDAKCRKGATANTGAVTSVTSVYVFTDSSRAEAADWFGNGWVKFTTGQNAGLPAKEIKSFAAGGVIEIHEAFYYPVAIGDAMEIMVGCRKTIEMCNDKHANVDNFGGFPNVPTNTTYTQIGRKITTVT